ncbi:bacteriocin biosynthesis cyclodehydratase domain-containing protein [Streptomyces sp. yr375]|uniref:hypothetical protein n=1 Tax=Streptomyces sp. yr375 TaxID=1761906 RepID=UPI0008BD66A6|nr:hypothetical protein [Streptomyces sp. yr375]SER48144.1 bacteriocin biosynthesis cyclodehydratase domain-containing protein [Streptomyces sp. yr375]
MTNVDATRDVVVGATDVEWKTLGNSRFEILVGARKFVVEAKGEKGEALRYVMADVVPKLRRTAAVREQLSAPEAERLLPYMEKLAAMGVLLYPKEPIGTEGELRLYSFIARRSAAPDGVFASVRRDIGVTGPPRMADALGGALRRQGLRVRDGDAGDSALNVVVSLADEAVLRRTNRELCAAGRSFLPLLVTPRTIRIGPWTMPGESACLDCCAPYDTATTATATPAARDSGVAHDSWPTLQSGCLEWAAGLTAHLTLRAFMPQGAEHPWGRVVTLDPAACEQTSVRAWRDPYCASCASAGPTAQEWLEF